MSIKEKSVGPRGSVTYPIQLAMPGSRTLLLLTLQKNIQIPVPRTHTDTETFTCFGSYQHFCGFFCM
jgi:hypothetical protein